MMSNCGKNKKVAQQPPGKWVTDVLTTIRCLQFFFLNRRMAKWNLFVLYNKGVKRDVIYASVFQQILDSEQSRML